MSNSGVALMGSALAAGENRAMLAIEEALTSPLLNNNDIKGAKNILLNIASGPDDEVRMDEIGQITDYVQESAGMTADIIWGNTLDNSLGDKICITIIATGFGTDSIPELVAHEAEQKVSVPLMEVSRHQNQSLVVDKKIYDKLDGDDIPFEVLDKKADSEGALLDLAEDEPVEEIERFDLFSDEKQETKKPVAKQLDLDLISAGNKEDFKVEKAQKPKISYKNESDIEELENEPAFKRKKVTLDEIDEVEEQEKEISRYTLTDEEGVTRISNENSFLFDNVD
jgi:cell division protein FtsZ